MRLDLRASELLCQLDELYPFTGAVRLRAELAVEDAIRAAVQEDRERVLARIQTRIALLRRRDTAFSQNAANCLEEIVKALDDEVEPNVVPPEDVPW